MKRYSYTARTECGCYFKIGQSDRPPGRLGAPWEIIEVVDGADPWGGGERGEGLKQLLSSVGVLPVHGREVFRSSDLIAMLAGAEKRRDDDAIAVYGAFVAHVRYGLPLSEPTSDPAPILRLVPSPGF